MKRQQRCCGEIEKSGKITSLSQRIPFWYLQMCKIRKSGKDILATFKNGDTLEVYNLPVADIGVLMLGPGTSMTRDAAIVTAKRGCLVAWCGDKGTPVHSVSVEYRDITNKTRQFVMAGSQQWREFALWLLSAKRRNVVKSVPMLPPFPEDIEKLDGMSYLLTEARWAKAAYAVTWRSGRLGDSANARLDLLNSYLYSLVYVVLSRLGYEPGLGVVHSRTAGGGLVFDIADVYKPAMTLWLVHQAALVHLTDAQVRDLFAKWLIRNRVVDDMIDLVNDLFAKDWSQSSDKISRRIERCGWDWTVHRTGPQAASSVVLLGG